MEGRKRKRKGKMTWLLEQELTWLPSAFCYSRASQIKLPFAVLALLQGNKLSVEKAPAEQGEAESTAS